MLGTARDKSDLGNERRGIGRMILPIYIRLACVLLKNKLTALLPQAGRADWQRIHRLSCDQSRNIVAHIKRTASLRMDECNLKRHPIYVPHIQSKQAMVNIVLLIKLIPQLVLCRRIKRIPSRCRGPRQMTLRYWEMMSIVRRHRVGTDEADKVESVGFQGMVHREQNGKCYLTRVERAPLPGASTDQTINDPNRAIGAEC